MYDTKKDGREDNTRSEFDNKKCSNLIGGEEKMDKRRMSRKFPGQLQRGEDYQNGLVRSRVTRRNWWKS